MKNPLSQLLAVTYIKRYIYSYIIIKQTVIKMYRNYGITLSVENKIVRMSFPWVVSNPVLKTIAKQPPSGVFIWKVWNKLQKSKTLDWKLK